MAFLVTAMPSESKMCIFIDLFLPEIDFEIWNAFYSVSTSYLGEMFKQSVQSSTEA
jgi:hypothetical protein